MLIYFRPALRVDSTSESVTVAGSLRATAWVIITEPEDMKLVSLVIKRTYGPKVEFPETTFSIVNCSPTASRNLRLASCGNLLFMFFKTRKNDNLYKLT